MNIKKMNKIIFTIHEPFYLIFHFFTKDLFDFDFSLFHFLFLNKSYIFLIKLIYFQLI